MWSIGGMTMTRKNQSARRQTGPSATFSNINLTWTGPGSNPDLPTETNRINARIIKKLPYLWKLKFNCDIQSPSPVSCVVMPCSL